MSIRIVTHCYAKELPQYAVFLRSQLSSIATYKCKVSIHFTVVCSCIDYRTEKVVCDFFDDISLLSIYHVENCHLFKRAIARNVIALGCEQDLIWFTDADYFFGKDCLNSLWDAYQNVPDDVVLIWPDSSFIHLNHEIGDVFWRSNSEAIGCIYPNLNSDFKLIRYDKAIGGLQIVPRKYANKYGYLDKTKWTAHEENVVEFRNTMEDIKFRKACIDRGPDMSVTLKNLYRLRHTQHGWPEL